MNKYAIILIMAVFVLSCRNTKDIVKSNTEVKTETKSDNTASKVEKTTTNTLSNVSENTTEDEYVVTEETITELSKPDSTGNQHPEKITKRTTTSGKNKETKVAENTEINQATNNEITETEKKSENSTLSNETDIKTVKKSQSWKITALIILALSIVGFIIYKWKGTAIKTAIKGLIK